MPRNQIIARDDDPQDVEIESTLGPYPCYLLQLQAGYPKDPASDTKDSQITPRYSGTTTIP